MYHLLVQSIHAHPMEYFRAMSATAVENLGMETVLMARVNLACLSFTFGGYLKNIGFHY